MLQDEIQRLGSYFRGIDYYNDALIVRVVFPKNWQIFPSDDMKIKPARGDDGSEEIFYHCNAKEASLDDIFKLINETINGNTDAERKIALFNEKMTELQEIFKKNPYEKLQRLIFDFEKKPKKLTKKSLKKKDEPVEETPTEENNAPEEVTENEEGNK